MKILTNRLSLLTSLFEAKDNKEAKIRQILKLDEKFIKRTIQEIENEIEDLEEALAVRLQSETPIDKSTIEVGYASILNKRSTLDLYKKFEQEFLSKS